MLETLRAGTQNVVVKFGLMVMVLIFVAWGVSDVLRHQNTGEVARVGKTSVMHHEFDKALHREVQQLSSMLGYTPSKEQMQLFNLSQHVLNQLVEEKLLITEADRLGLAVGDEAIIRAVQKNPIFNGADGRFSKKRFSRMLEQNHLSESEFIELIRHNLSSSFLQRMIGAVPTHYTELAKHLYAHMHEKMLVDVIRVTPLRTQDLVFDEPDESDLTARYKTYIAKYQIPEYRSLSYIALTLETLLSTVSATDEEVRQEYEANIHMYNQPEERNIEQLFFVEEESALRAWEALKINPNFYEAAQKLSALDSEDIALGYISKDRLPEEVANHVFDLQQHVVTRPLKSHLGWHIFKVNDIKPALNVSFKKAKEEIATQLKRAKAQDELYRVIDDIDEHFSQGDSLEDVAKTYHLRVESIKDIASNGEQAASQSLKSLAKDKQFLKLAFSQPLQRHSPMTLASDERTYYVLRVDTVTPSKTKPFESVKQDIFNDWKEQRSQQLQADHAFTLLHALKSNDPPIERLEKQKKLTIEKDVLIDRPLETIFGGYQHSLPLDLQKEVFSLAKDEMSELYTDSQGHHLFVKAKKRIQADEATLKESLPKFQFELEQTVKNDMMVLYQNYLRKKHPVSINQSVLSAE